MRAFRSFRRRRIALLTVPYLLWISLFGAFYCDSLGFKKTKRKEKGKKRTAESLEPPAETPTSPGSCTRTTPGTTTRRPAAAAPLRSSLTPSQVAAARSEARSLPQATRYGDTSPSPRRRRLPSPSFRTVQVAAGQTINPVTQIPLVFSAAFWTQSPLSLCSHCSAEIAVHICDARA